MLLYVHIDHKDAKDVHLDLHTALELWNDVHSYRNMNVYRMKAHL